jgi:hypothetical protein
LMNPKNLYSHEREQRSPFTESELDVTLVVLMFMAEY